MKTQRLQNTPAEITIAGKMIAAGKLVAIPTETVYGLGANALDPEAVKKIFTAKGRPQDNPLIVHISRQEEMAPLVTHVPELAQKLMEAFWPGPLTIILPKTDRVPYETSGGLDTVAIRLPEHPVARAVIAAAGVPVAAPSANTSGLPSPTTAGRVLEDMDGKIAAVLDGGPCHVGVESTVVTLAGDKPRLLRPGGVTLEQMEAVIGPITVDPAVLNRIADGAQVASPGMKYKHYAPKANIVIIKSSFCAFQKYVEAYQGDGIYALCFDNEDVSLTVPAVCYGAADDGAAQAHRLFDALRKLDDLGAKTVFARCPAPDGMGMAVYNRMIRAAAYQVFDLDKLHIIGLTGPTGAGKSYVAGLFSRHGHHIIDTDRIARSLTGPGSPVLEPLAAAFGKDILLDGQLERKKLAQRAFQDEASQNLLNSITHPAVIRQSMEEIQKWSKKGYTNFVLDVPLLFESGMDAFCSCTVAVLADEDVRRERILLRDKLTGEQASQRLGIQKKCSFYEQRADHIVWNNGAEDLNEAIHQIIS